MIKDDAGRELAPDATVIRPRPPGPWDTNVCAWCTPKDQRQPGQSHGICPSCAAIFAQGGRRDQTGS